MLELQRVGSNCRDIAGELHRAQQEIASGSGHQRAEELQQDLARAASRSGLICRLYLCCISGKSALGLSLPTDSHFLLLPLVVMRLFGINRLRLV